MKKIFLVIFTIPATLLFAQNSNKELNELHQQIVQQEKKVDSSLKKMDSFNSNLSIQTNSIDSLTHVRDMESMNRNMDGLLRDIKERQDKEKRNALIRICFGVLLAAFGVYALTRKRKPRS